MGKELQILVFTLGKQYWGLNILDVREVVKIKSYTPVPGAPQYILGVFNLRGQIVPLIDISMFLNIANSNGLREAVIINHDNELIGIAVEDVVGVARVAEDRILPPPNEVGDHVRGVIETPGRVVSVIDLKRILEKISTQQQ